MTFNNPVRFGIVLCARKGCENPVRIVNGRLLKYCSDSHRVRAANDTWRDRERWRKAMRANIHARLTTTSGHDKSPWLATIVIEGKPFYRYGPSQEAAVAKLLKSMEDRRG
jgi:hypothetical protein